jgi:hypothetical protein
VNSKLKHIKTTIYQHCDLKLSNFEAEVESNDYEACSYQLNRLKIISRTAKKTPKKIGQFVTFWKRGNNGPIAPFNECDMFDFFVVNIATENEQGQFVFPKSVLIKKGIISTKYKEGKRAFRVYPIWDHPTSKQAITTQKWQLSYFFMINSATDLTKVVDLYARI